jgi:predicted CXXCH cytochrome family protein
VGAPPHTPFASLAREGWSLIDVERAYRLRDGVYWVPPAPARGALEAGAVARLLFVWADAGPADPLRERLWVEVQRRVGDIYVGRLLVEPAAAAPISEEAEVWFAPEHVTDLGWPDQPPLSARSGLVQCPDHGWSEPVPVCPHLAAGRPDRFVERRDAARLRPGARCGDCHDAESGSGGALLGLAPATICAGCYDRLRDHLPAQREGA